MEEGEQERKERAGKESYSFILDFQLLFSIFSCKYLVYLPLGSNEMLWPDTQVSVSPVPRQGQDFIVEVTN